jgi:hypothetical protein
MEEKEICIGKNIKLISINYYKKLGQYIIGITANREHEYFASNSLYEEVALKRIKYELNIWLVFISFHLEILGKMKKADNSTERRV